MSIADRHPDRAGQGEGPDLRPRLRRARRVRRSADGGPRAAGGRPSATSWRPPPGTLGQLARARARSRDLASAAHRRSAGSRRRWPRSTVARFAGNDRRRALLEVEGRRSRSPRQPARQRRRPDRALTDLGYLHDNPRLSPPRHGATPLSPGRRTDSPEPLRRMATAENTALGEADDMLGVPFLCDWRRCSARSASWTSPRVPRPGRVREARCSRASCRLDPFLSTPARARGDPDAAFAGRPPADWWQVELVAGSPMARKATPRRARRHGMPCREIACSASATPPRWARGRATSGSRRPFTRGRAGPPAPVATGPAPPPPQRRKRRRRDGDALTGGEDGGTAPCAAGQPARLVGVVAACGGSATLDQSARRSGPVTTSRQPDPAAQRVDAAAPGRRRRHRALRLRLRFAAGVRCDSTTSTSANDASAAARADPDLAGHWPRGPGQATAPRSPTSSTRSGWSRPGGSSSSG